jgi:hypothetical protein
MKDKIASVVGRTGEEKGAALVIALMVMILCAILGAASILTTNTDIQIGINERIYHEALMNAEAGVQWLRRQDLQTMSSWSAGTLTTLNNTTLPAAGTAVGIRFRVPQNPVFVWNDPQAGGAQVFRVRSQGSDRGQRGSVTIEAEIRMAPAAGPVTGGAAPEF